MDFKRVEVKKVVRHREQVSDKAEIKKILESLSTHRLKFSARLDGYDVLRDCSISSLGEDSVTVYAGSLRMKVGAKFDQVISVEVESNCDFIAEEHDEDGRWSRLI